MKKKLLFFLVVLSSGFSDACMSQDLKDCKAYLYNDTLTLENGRIFQHFRLDNGNLIRLDFGLQSSKRPNPFPDIEKKIQNIATQGSKILITEEKATATTSSYLKVIVSYSAGKLNIQKVFRLFPNCPAIPCDLYFKGSVENGSKDLRKLQEEILTRNERIPLLGGVHWRARSVEFYDATDRNNTLVQTYDRLAFTQECQMRGNLLFLENVLSGQRIFLLKEAPTSSAQLYYPGYDFGLKRNEGALPVMALLLQI
jgi:hypothetical protein